MTKKTILVLSLCIILAASIAVSTQKANAVVAVVIPGYDTRLFAQEVLAPHGIAFDKRDNLYVAQEGYTGSTGGAPGTTIMKITPDGKKSIFAGGFVGPAGIAVDKQGNVWVGDDSNNYGIDGIDIWKITPEGVVVPMYQISANPNTLAFDNDGNLFVAETFGGGIYKITQTGIISLFANGFPIVQALAFDESGYVYTRDASGQIWKLDPSGLTRVLFATVADSEGNFAFDKYGYLLVPSGDGRVLRISPSGQIETFATGLSSRPRGAAFDSKGSLYISDWFMDTVWKITQQKPYFGKPAHYDWYLTADIMPAPPYGFYDIPGSDTDSKLIVTRFEGSTVLKLEGKMKGLTPFTQYQVMIANAYEPKGLPGEGWPGQLVQEVFYFAVDQNGNANWSWELSNSDFPQTLQRPYTHSISVWINLIPSAGQWSILGSSNFQVTLPPL